MYSNRITALVVALMIWTVSVFAQPIQQLPDQNFDPGDLSGVVGPPTVQITEVKPASAQGTGFQLRVKWTAQVPGTTTVEKFEVSVTVRDSNNNIRTGTKTAVSSAREVLVPVAITAKPVSFQARITTFFIPLNQAKVELNSSILLDKGNGFSGSGATGQTTPQPSGDAINQVALADNTGFKGFEVKWRLRTRTQDVIEKQTNISGTFTYKQSNQTVGTRSATTTVGVGTRQTRLTVNSAPIDSLANVRIEAAIKIEVIFNLRKRLISTLDGNFPIN